MNDLRIRKLTPKECMRLMGFSDEDYQALVDSGLSNAAIYHCAGDSIITTCLASIIYPLTSEDRQGHKAVVEDYIEHYIIEERKIENDNHKTKNKPRRLFCGGWWC